MQAGHVRCGIGFAVWLGLFTWSGSATVALAEGASRVLPSSYVPGVGLGVSISIDPPPDTIVFLEDSPPAGWTAIADISEGGSYDAENHKVKWGPYLPNVAPPSVGYTVTPPANAAGQHCFSGEVSFGDNQPITGDDCVSLGIPAVSQWGLVAMTLLMLVAGTITIKPRCRVRSIR